MKLKDLCSSNQSGTTASAQGEYYTIGGSGSYSFFRKEGLCTSDFDSVSSDRIKSIARTTFSANLFRAYDTCTRSISKDNASLSNDHTILITGTTVDWNPPEIVPGNVPDARRFPGYYFVIKFRWIPISNDPNMKARTVAAVTDEEQISKCKGNWTSIADNIFYSDKQKNTSTIIPNREYIFSCDRIISQAKNMKLTLAVEGYGLVDLEFPQKTTE